MDNYNYPLGTDTPNAPWNESGDTDYVEKNVEISISLSNTIKIKTNDYVEQVYEDYDVDYDEDGNRIVAGGTYTEEDFSNTDWNSAYRNDECNILNLLKEYGEILKKEIDSVTVDINNQKTVLADNPKNKNCKANIRILNNKLSLLKRKYNACNNYIIDDLEVFEADGK